MSGSPVPSSPTAAHAGADRPTRGYSRAATAILVLALLLRIVWAVAVPVAPISDGHAYDIFAKNLAADVGFGWEPHKPSAYWPVGTPFVYSLVYRAFPPDAWGFRPVVVLNLALGVMLVGLVMRLARRWFGQGPALFAGLIVALWPVQIQMTTLLHSETMFTALVAWGLLLMPRTRTDFLRMVLAGLVFAAASYVRPTALLMPATFIGAAFLRDLDLRGALVKGVVMGAVMLAAILPWTYRNYRVFGEVVLISTNGPVTFWMGNAPVANGAGQEEPPIPEGMNEAQHFRKLGAEAWAHVRAHPGDYARRSLNRVVQLHERETIGVTWNSEGLKGRVSDRTVKVLKLVSTACWFALLAAAVAGILVLIGESGVWFGVTHAGVVLWIYLTVVHALVLAQDRYHLPAAPALCALAGLACFQVWRRVRPVPAVSGATAA